MKYLKERREIAEAMNFGKYPVLYVDLDKPRYPSKDFYVGSKCRVAWDLPDGRYAGMSARCTVYHYEGKYELSQGGCCLHDSFGRHDIIEDMEWANTPLLHCGQIVLMVEDQSIQGKCRVRVLRADDKKDIHCSTVVRLVDVDEEVKL